MKVQIKKDVLGEDEEQTVFGKTGKAGEALEVDDKYAEKAKGNPTLEVSGGGGGGPRPKPKPDEDEDEDDGEPVPLPPPSEGVEASRPRRGRPPGS